MFYSLARIGHKLNHRWLNWCCRAIDRTPPVTCDPRSEVTVVSQLHHPDLTLYMLAAKSLARFLRPRGFLVVDDGLSDGDRQKLLAHFDAIRFIPRREIDTGRCPRGGTWERLLALSAQNIDSYVIQLDADTLTLQEPVEVLACVEAKRSFTLGTPSGTRLVGLDQASRFAHEHRNAHVQNEAERALGNYPGREGRKYVRGCSGFTGFAQGQLPRAAIEEFSDNMHALLGGERWQRWGTEQVTSNYMAANAPDALVLPFERYPFWHRSTAIEKAAFVHFYGPSRFQDGEYIRQARGLVGDLLAANRTRHQLFL